MSLLAFNGTCINSAMSDHFNFPWLFFKMAIKFKNIFSDHFLTCGNSVISTLVAKSGNKLTPLQVGILNLYTSYHALLIQAENEHKQQSISNSNLTEWSTIQGVIVRIQVFKIGWKRSARPNFEIMTTIPSWIVHHEVQ